MSTPIYEQVICEHPDHRKRGDPPQYVWLPRAEVQRLKAARLPLLCEAHRGRTAGERTRGVTLQL